MSGQGKVSTDCQYACNVTTTFSELAYCPGKKHKSTQITLAINSVNFISFFIPLINFCIPAMDRS